jgi:hypothetical protein
MPAPTRRSSGIRWRISRRRHGDRVGVPRGIWAWIRTGRCWPCSRARAAQEVAASSARSSRAAEVVRRAPGRAARRCGEQHACPPDRTRRRRSRDRGRLVAAAPRTRGPGEVGHEHAAGRAGRHAAGGDVPGASLTLLHGAPAGARAARRAGQPRGRRTRRTGAAAGGRHAANVWRPTRCCRCWMNESGARGARSRGLARVRAALGRRPPGMAGGRPGADLAAELVSA